MLGEQAQPAEHPSARTDRHHHRRAQPQPVVGRGGSTIVGELLGAVLRQLPEQQRLAARHHLREVRSVPAQLAQFAQPALVGPVAGGHGRREGRVQPGHPQQPALGGVALRLGWG
jgi:hypothetical protein